METLDWAKRRYRAYQQIAEQRARTRGQNKKDELDANEIGKLIATLRQRGQVELYQVADAFAATDRNGRATNPFARRSGKYAQAFADLRHHVVDRLPQNQQESLRSMRWLKRLLDLEDSDRKQHRQGQDNLLRWLLHGEQVTASAQPTPSLQPSAQPSRPVPGEQRSRKKKGKR